MLVLYIVLGVLFLITWVVIGVSSTSDEPTPTDSYKPCYEPSYYEVKSQNNKLLYENRELRYELSMCRRDSYCCNRKCCTSQDDFKELKQLIENMDKLPTELNIEGKTYKQK